MLIALAVHSDVRRQTPGCPSRKLVIDGRSKRVVILRSRVKYV